MDSTFILWAAAAFLLFIVAFLLGAIIWGDYNDQKEEVKRFYEKVAAIDPSAVPASVRAGEYLTDLAENLVTLANHDNREIRLAAQYLQADMNRREQGRTRWWANMSR